VWWKSVDKHVLRSHSLAQSDIPVSSEPSLLATGLTHQSRYSRENHCPHFSIKIQVSAFDFVSPTALKVRPTNDLNLQVRYQCMSLLNHVSSSVSRPMILPSLCRTAKRPPILNVQLSSPSPSDLVAVSGGVVLRTDNQTSPLLSSLVNCLDDIDQLLLILEYPIKLVVVTSSEIAHLCTVIFRGIVQL